MTNSLGLKGPARNFDPCRNAAPVTKSDTDTLNPHPLFLYVGTGGAADLVVDMADTGTTVTFKNVPSGTVLPIQVQRVRTTSTVNDVVAMW